MISQNRFVISLVFLLLLGLSPISLSRAETLPPQETTITNFSCYRDGTSLVAKMAYLAGKYPRLIAINSIGSSVEKRTITAYEIGNQANPNKPHFILMTGLHGNDFSQPELGLQLAETLLEGYKTDTDLHWIVDNVELDLILLANPDGRLEAEAQAEIPFAEPSDVYSINNSHGVNLEKNFCVAHPESQGCKLTNYEPETLAILNYLNEKLGVPDPDQTPNNLSRDLFVYFSSHNEASMLPIGDIRIPWFYKPNPSELLELTDPALKWQYELATMLKMLDPELKGSIEPKIAGDIFSDYPVDYVFRSFAIASLELSAYPTMKNLPLDCLRFQDNHPEYYLQVFLNMAKSAAQPYKMGYGPLVKDLDYTGKTEERILYHAVLWEKNQAGGQYEPNPITAVHYYIDQPIGTISGELSGWQEVEGIDNIWELDFGIEVSTLDLDKHILTLQACNASGECGLPHSQFLDLRNPGDPEPTEPPDKPEPPNAEESKIFLPLIGR